MADKQERKQVQAVQEKNLKPGIGGSRVHITTLLPATWLVRVAPARRGVGYTTVINLLILVTRRGVSACIGGGGRGERRENFFVFGSFERTDIFYKTRRNAQHIWNDYVRPPAGEVSRIPAHGRRGTP